jgi:hypothetical protein
VFFLRPSKETSRRQASVTASQAVKISIKKAWAYRWLEFVPVDKLRVNAKSASQASSLKKKNLLRSAVQFRSSSRHEAYIK